MDLTRRVSVFISKTCKQPETARWISGPDFSHHDELSALDQDLGRD